MKWRSSINNLFKDYRFEIISLFFLFCLFFLIYGHYLNLYFSQDDFFHFRISQTNGSIREFVELFFFKNFSERGEIYFYRPIFREAFYNIFYRAFGLKPLAYRLFQLLIHSINIFLTYILINRLTKDKTTALLSVIFFTISSLNIGILSYLGGGIQNSGMLVFALISFNSYLSYLQKNKMKYKFISIIFFIFSLASHEISIMIPVVNVGIFIFLKGMNLRNIFTALKDNLLYILASFCLLIFEVFKIGLPVAETQYSFSFSFSKLLNSYFWYSAWSVGVPEMLVDFVGPGLKLNPDLMKYWGGYFYIIFPSILIVIFFFLKNIYLLLKSKTFYLLLFWAFIGIGPVVFLPFHKQSYYLTFVLPAVAGIVGLTTRSIYNKNKALGYLFIGTVFLLNIVTSKLTDNTYWAINRGKIAEKLARELKTKYPTLPKGAKVYFKNAPNQPFFNVDWGHSSKQAFIVFSGSEAVKLIYNDDSLESYYEDIKIPTDSELVFPIEAVIY